MMRTEVTMLFVASARFFSLLMVSANRSAFSSNAIINEVTAVADLRLFKSSQAICWTESNRLEAVLRTLCNNSATKVSLSLWEGITYNSWRRRWAKACKILATTSRSPPYKVLVSVADERSKAKSLRLEAPCKRCSRRLNHKDRHSPKLGLSEDHIPSSPQVHRAKPDDPWGHTWMASSPIFVLSSIYCISIITQPDEFW